ncbi:MAG: YidC/Oxa1 family rane protein insertase [Frankiaceae bacterium]|nr:YidC/Oxa1 family rane protein insertase [Frankiaceae bacterium]
MIQAFHALFALIAQAIVKLHDYITGPVLGKNSGLSWALAIMLLTVIVRGLMYPLFVKQIKTQRTMSALQPKMAELKAKHKGDKETLNTEMMKLYKEHGANPLAGCLPMLLQMPIFISLFQVLKQLEPKLYGTGAEAHYDFPVKFGLTKATIKSLQSSKIFGAPIGAGFKSPAKLLEFLHASPGAVKIVAIVLIIAMTATTFITSKQMMGKNPSADPSQATQQKVLLYVMPLFLGVFGFQVAIGVLIYWTTTNVFSMVQQAVVMRHLGPVGSTPAAAAKPAKPAAKPAPNKRPATATPAASTANGAAAPADAPDGGARTPAAAGARRPNNRNTKRGKGQRRGGRR